jgi:hypothetical protein
MDSQAIPAALFAIMALISGAWKILDFTRDARVKRAELDAADEHARLVRAIEENESLRASLARAQQELKLKILEKG